jgi:hypothetical protein
MLNPVSLLPSDFPAYKTPGVLEGTQTGNHANSAAPSSASLSNTAAGYTTLGGKWQFAAVGSAETDFALFAYQVPATHRLFVSGVAISAINTGAAVATTASVLEWALGLNSTAVSLATTDSDPVFAPRRVQLGLQAFAVAAAIGALAQDLWRTFDQPLIVQPSRYLHLILKCPIGTATGSQVIRGQATIDGYFEKV